MPFWTPWRSCAQRSAGSSRPCRRWRKTLGGSARAGPPAVSIPPEGAAPSGRAPFSELWAGAVEASRGGLLLRGEEAEALRPGPPAGRQRRRTGEGYRVRIRASGALPAVGAGGSGEPLPPVRGTGTRVRPSAERGAAVSSVRRFRIPKGPRALHPPQPNELVHTIGDANGSGSDIQNSGRGDS